MRESANFWHRIWSDSGCPSSGVLFQIKKNAKSRYKYEVRRLKRSQRTLLRTKIASSFAKKKKQNVWDQVRQLNRSRSSNTSVVDGVSGNVSIANLFASKFESVLNTHSPSLHDNLHSSVQSSITSLHMDEVHFSDTEVLEALSQLKSHKSDNDGLSSEHLKLASPAIAKHLAVLFTSVVRHGYLPRCLSDCVLIPIPKGKMPLAVIIIVPSLLPLL